MKIPANASVHYVAATRKRDTRHCWQRSNSRDRPAHTRDLRGIFSQWRFYELFMGSFFPGEVCRGISISATRSPRDTTHVCKRHCDESLLPLERTKYENHCLIKIYAMIDIIYSLKQMYIIHVLLFLLISFFLS